MGFNLGKAIKGYTHTLGKAATLGAHIGPAGAVFGLLGGGKDPGIGQAAEARRLYQQGLSQAGQNTAQSIAGQQRALGDTKTAFGGARTALGSGQTQAIQAAQDQGAQAGARATQSLVSSGLGNTTITENAQQGITAGQTRAIADIDSHYAQMLAQLGIGEAAATTGIRQGIGSSYERLAGLNAGILGNQAQTVASISYSDPNLWLDNLLGLAGTAGGIALGKAL